MRFFYGFFGIYDLCFVNYFDIQGNHM